MVKEPLKLRHFDSVERMMEALNQLHEEKEIRALMVVYFDPAGYITTAWSQVASVTRAVGALERVKFDILASED